MRKAPQIKEIFSYPVTAGTALLAIGITVAWWLKVDITPVVENALIRQGELWRLVTYIFPHIDILHLAFNIYWVWFFGTAVEGVYGHLKTAALIVLFAFGSGAMEYAFADGGVGLSGVGYAFFGLIWILSLHDERFRDAIDRKTVQIFIIWFFFCIFTTIIKFMAVANIAHGAGAVLGIAVGFAIIQPTRRFIHVTGIAIILIFGLWAATFGRSLVNLSDNAGMDEARRGYDALVAHNYPDAVRWCRDAIAYRPQTSSYWYNLGIAYEGAGNKPQSAEAYRKAAELGDAKAQYFVGSLYENGSENLPKDTAQAVYWFTKAVAQNDPEALNDVAWIYVTSSDPAIHNPTLGLEYARRVIEIEKDHPNPSYLDTLAEACYANGLNEEAVKTEQQAIALASPELQIEFKKGLEKYQLALKNQRSKT